MPNRPVDAATVSPARAIAASPAACTRVLRAAWLRPSQPVRVRRVVGAVLVVVMLVMACSSSSLRVRVLLGSLLFCCGTAERTPAPSPGAHSRGPGAWPHLGIGGVAVSPVRADGGRVLGNGQRADVPLAGPLPLPGRGPVRGIVDEFVIPAHRRSPAPA